MIMNGHISLIIQLAAILLVCTGLALFLGWMLGKRSARAKAAKAAAEAATPSTAAPGAAGSQPESLAARKLEEQESPLTATQTAPLMVAATPGAQPVAEAQEMAPQSNSSPFAPDPALYTAPATSADPAAAPQAVPARSMPDPLSDDTISGEPDELSPAAQDIAAPVAARAEDAEDNAQRPDYLNDQTVSDESTIETHMIPRIINDTPAPTPQPALDSRLLEAESRANEAEARVREAEAKLEEANQRAHEAEAKAEKEARKEAGDTTPQGDVDAAIKKGPAPKVRPLIERRGKAYRKLAEKVEKDKAYSLDEALQLATETNPAKFDASVELHVRLGVDPRQADQNIRSTVVLPHGTGKTVRVAVFAPEAEVATATKAGADIAGEEAIIKLLDKGTLDFDVLIATPQYMPKLGKYARLLGPKGLMPNPKSGTVTTDIATAVTEAKAGKVEYRVDKQAAIHLSIGKVSFGTEKLRANADAFFASLQAQKPSSLKGVYVKSIAAATTMGPGIKVEHKLD